MSKSSFLLPLNPEPEIILILPCKRSQAQVITWLFQDESLKKKINISQLLEIVDFFFFSPPLLKPLKQATHCRLGSPATHGYLAVPIPYFLTVTWPPERGPRVIPPVAVNTPVDGDDITSVMEVTDLLPVRYSVTDY